MKWFINEMNVQKKLTDQILINDTGVAKVGTSYIPVIIYESNRDNTEHKNIDIVIPEIELNNNAKSSIKNSAYSQFSQLE